MRPLGYLAGAIRDHHPEDLEWRERFVDRLIDRCDLINPLAGKTFNEETGLWTICGIPTTKHLIVAADFAAVDRADFIVFNFLALADGYPMIGSLTEWGRSTNRSILRFGIIPPKYLGHGNLRTFQCLHPFLDEPMAAAFDTPNACLDFLEDYLGVLSGRDARYRGVIHLMSERFGDAAERTV